METTHDARVNSPGIIKIIGIGQSLRGDDGAGIAAVHLWQQCYQAKGDRPNLQVELAEVPGIGLLSLLEGAATAILVDAIRTGAPPGTLMVVAEDQLEAFHSSSGSAHGFGVAETLSLGRKLMPGKLPKKLIIIGVEAGQLSLGDKLSREVSDVLPRVANLIEQYVSAS